MPTRNQLTREQKLEFCHEVTSRHMSFAALCRAFRITRQTGYKWWQRYEAGGVAALAEQSRRPRCCPFQLRPHWIERIRQTRHRFPRWDAKKLQAWMRREFPRARLPAVSSIGRVLRRLHLSQPRPRRLRGPVRTWPPFRMARRPNEVWTVDFKGYFRTTDASIATAFPRNTCDVRVGSTLEHLAVNRIGYDRLIFPSQILVEQLDHMFTGYV